MEVNGEVDSTNLNMIFLGASRSKEEKEVIGKKFTSMLIKEDPIPFWTKRPKKQQCFFDSFKKLDTKSLVHAVSVSTQHIIYEVYSNCNNVKTSHRMDFNRQHVINVAGFLMVPLKFQT